MTQAELNKESFKQFLDDRGLEWQPITLWEFAIYPTEYQRGSGVEHTIESFEGSTSFVGYRYWNADVWIVELPRIIYN